MLIDMKTMVSKVAPFHGTMPADTAIYMAMEIWNLTKFLSLPVKKSCDFFKSSEFCFQNEDISFSVISMAILIVH